MEFNESSNDISEKSSQPSLSRTLISIALCSSFIHSIIAFNTVASDNIAHLTRSKD
nr:MAG TPA: hypothetical protein [Caudoviricetes sp.]